MIHVNIFFPKDLEVLTNIYVPFSQLRKLIICDQLIYLHF